MRHFHFITAASLIVLSSGLTGCASLQGMMGKLSTGKVTTSADMSKAVPITPLMSAPETIVMESKPETVIPSLIMPGQMKANPASFNYVSPPERSGFHAVSYANRAAIVEPSSDNYLNAIQLYPYTPGSLYQVYTSPSQVTDIALEKGEALTSVSAGDTDRWTVGDTVSGSGANEQVHILVKPMAPELSTNAVITTTKRTYYLDLKSFADTYMAAVSWRYPHEAITNIRKRVTDSVNVTSFNQVKSPLDFEAEALRFDYTIKGDTPHWRPTRVFDDGRKIYIEFPKELATAEAPPLFVTDGEGEDGKLVNYRVHDSFYIVDRLFDYAELRLGETDQTIVRIERET